MANGTPQAPEAPKEQAQEPATVTAIQPGMGGISATPTEAGVHSILNETSSPSEVTMKLKSASDAAKLAAQNFAKHHADLYRALAHTLWLCEHANQGVEARLEIETLVKAAGIKLTNRVTLDLALCKVVFAGYAPNNINNYMSVLQTASERNIGHDGLVEVLKEMGIMKFIRKEKHDADPPIPIPITCELPGVILAEGQTSIAGKLEKSASGAWQFVPRVALPHETTPE